MKYLCAACQRDFDGRDSKCENWRIQERSFGCPHCGAWLEKPAFKHEISTIEKIILFVELSPLLITSLLPDVANYLVLSYGSAIEIIAVLLTVSFGVHGLYRLISGGKRILARRKCAQPTKLAEEV